MPARVHSTFSAIGCYAVDLTGTVNRWVRINMHLTRRCDQLHGYGGGDRVRCNQPGTGSTVDRTLVALGGTQVAAIKKAQGNSSLSYNSNELKTYLASIKLTADGKTIDITTLGDTAKAVIADDTAWSITA